tara:strand:- start:60 stop:305 length:246 start_codon:yes stop_codon:yes gene_type:complete
MVERLGEVGRVSSCMWIPKGRSHMLSEGCIPMYWSSRMRIGIKMWQRFKEWLIIRQSAKFAKELKRKGYKPRKPWDVGIWK